MNPEETPLDPLRRLTPRRPSPALRGRIFSNRTDSPHGWRLRIPWVRVCLVVSSVWFAALTVAWSPNTSVTHPPRSGGLTGHSALVAQNSLPARLFTMTNPPAGHSTNRPGQAL